MGQQQLLLLVLGVVIVGLAVVVGIQAFSENQKSANQDAMVNDAVRIASEAQAWAQKPKQFGGPETTGDFSSLNFSDMGLASEPSTSDYENINGTYTLPTKSAGELKIQGISNETYDDGNNNICVTVGGTNPSDITTQTGTTC